MAPVVEFHEVTKDYRSGWWRTPPTRALDAVSLRIEPGEVFGLVGPNRAGKTTLVKLLLSLCQPSAGRIERFGQSSTQRNTLVRIGYVHENQAYPRYLSATSVLEFFGSLSLLPEPEVRRRVPRLLERVGIADRAHEPIARFSKGMIQRLGLAQAILSEPDLLVLDEPSEGLDLRGRQVLRDVLTEQRQRGRSALYVSHVLPEVEQLCQRVGVLVGGRLRFLGPTTDLAHGRSLESALETYYRQSTDAHSAPKHAELVRSHD